MPRKILDDPSHGPITIDTPPDGGRTPRDPLSIPTVVVENKPQTVVPIPASAGWKQTDLGGDK